MGPTAQEAAEVGVESADERNARVGANSQLVDQRPRVDGLRTKGSCATRLYDRPDMERHTNRLAGETSPYLLQHAHNPVDWYPWGPEALARAHAEDKPIFLSIGYAACHWCHVMERESFENEDTAQPLNDGFRGDQGRPRGAA